MAEPGHSTPDTAPTRRFLTFRMGNRLYAVAAETVSEVIRLPPVARVPQSPRALLGVANLRGAVLPIASLRGLLGQGEIASDAGSRAIVLEGGAPVGIAVDAVDALVSVEATTIQTDQAELAASTGERLSGAFRLEGRGEVAKILDIRPLVEAAFVPRARPERVATAALARGLFGEADGEAEARQKLVTFDVGGQEFGLALDDVREIVSAPDNLTTAPHSEAVVLGVTAYRDTLLPLLSLRRLLGLGPGDVDDRREKVVVTAVGSVLVGLVADRMRAIVSADPALIEPTPAMLAARTGGEAQIASIYRGEGGARLISILAADKLFREDVMTKLGQAGQAAAAVDNGKTAATQTRQFLVFQLCGDDFALPIEVVDEVARVPVQVTRLPKAPAFLEGVINLRGEVLPVIDQRRRFGMPAATNHAARRLIVVRTEHRRAGLIVDAVSEVLRSAGDAIEPAPDLSGEATQLVHGVINLEAAGRMVLLLDPTELLTRTERGLLDAFQARSATDGVEQPVA
jgi:purine-binding chemotaxis protein CheW